MRCEHKRSNREAILHLPRTLLGIIFRCESYIKIAFRSFIIPLDVASSAPHLDDLLCAHTVHTVVSVTPRERMRAAAQASRHRMRNRSLSHTVVYLCSALSMRTAHGRSCSRLR